MDNEFNPIQPVPPQTPGNQGLDPTVQALTQALGQHESGVDYSAKGKNKEQGAYQMTPGFLDEYAPKYIKDYQHGQELSPDQQNELAYNIVKEWGSTGNPHYPSLGKLSPAQIASSWNSGDPNAYLDEDYQGVNATSGAPFNVPKYVSDVESRYKENLARLTGQQPQENPIQKTTSLSDTESEKGPGIWDWLFHSQIMQNPVASPIGTVGALSWLLGGQNWKGAVNVGLPLAGAAIGTAIEPGAGSIAGELVGGKLAEMITGGGEKSPISNISGSPQEPLSSIINPNMEAEISALESSAPQLNKTARAIAEAQQNSLESTIGGRNLLNDSNIQEGIKTNALFGLIPEQNEQGINDSESALKKSNSLINGLSTNLSQMLSAGGEMANINTAKQEAYKNIEKYVDVPDQEEARSHVDKMAQSYVSKYGDDHGNMDLGSFEKMRKEMGDSFDRNDTTARRKAKKALYFGARRTVENTTTNKDLYNSAMKMEQNLINGQKVLKKLHNHKGVKNNVFMKNLLHIGGRYAALYIGDKIGGPIGAIIGDLVGNKLIRAVDKKFGRTIFETPEIRKGLELLKQESPVIYQRLIAELKKEGIKFTTEERLSKKYESGSTLSPKHKAKQGLVKLKGKQAKTSQSIWPQLPTPLLRIHPKPLS